MKIEKYYNVECYYRIGQHGSFLTHNNFEKAYKDAEGYNQMDSINNKIKEGLLYIGVSGNEDLFSIHYITKEYLNHIESNNPFSDEKSRENWLKAAKLALKTKLPVIGSYK